MTLSQSMEDYLEAIFVLDKEKRAVRVKDVSEKLGVTMPSVNGALKNLERKGLIHHEKYEYIELTEKGTETAAQIATRHRVIFQFLNDIIGVDAETSEKDACKIEHVLSNKTMQLLTDYIDKQSQASK